MEYFIYTHISIYFIHILYIFHDIHIFLISPLLIVQSNILSQDRITEFASKNINKHILPVLFVIFVNVEFFVFHLIFCQALIFS